MDFCPPFADTPYETTYNKKITKRLQPLLEKLQKIKFTFFQKTP
uniref:Uncharacterized protein n=1 Tax=Siphoviridae sp. ctB3v5 TaxID=2826186 RepID=A0A8S5M9P4_9CAUD|nr:MAG TPA: hypothetical protein [Siphoviridae sp. ctB3v5]